MVYQSYYSNTTLVKVKCVIKINGSEIHLKFKYNTC